MLPVKLLEYVALDIPAIVPRLPTIQYYFAEDMVQYYDPEDVESLAEAISQLHARSDARREQASRARAFINDYGWERQGAELVAMYRTMTKSRHL